MNAASVFTPSSGPAYGLGRDQPSEKHLHQRANAHSGEWQKEPLVALSGSTGKKNLGWDDFEWGLLSNNFICPGLGMAADWESSLDT